MQGPSTCELGHLRTRHHRQRPPPPRRPALLGGKPRRRRSRLHRRPRRLCVHRLRQAPRSQRGSRPSALTVRPTLHLAGQARPGWKPVLLARTHLERRSRCVPTAGPVCVPLARRHALELAGAESVSLGGSEGALRGLLRTLASSAARKSARPCRRRSSRYGVQSGNLL
jgi:hypothetical protein